MRKAIANRIRLAILRWAIAAVEAAGLSVVEIKKGPGVIYVRAANGQYVRYDKDRA